MSLHVIPSIDLREGKVVRLRQGDFARQTDYAVSPLEQARTFAAAGATLMHLVDLDGAKAGRVAQLSLIAEVIRGAGIPVQVGGGIRTTEDVRRLLNAGAARVVVGTAALENWDWFRSLAHESDHAGKLVLALDARDGIVATRGWTESSGRLATDLAREVTQWPLAGILYTDVAVDGMLTGPNVARTRELALATQVPVIASGGVGHLEHIRSLAGQGIWGVVVGRAIYEGQVDLRDALAVARHARAR